MYEHPCVDYRNPVFLCENCFWYGCLPCSLPAMISLTMCVIGVVVTRACTECETGPPLFSVASTALLGAGSAPQLLGKKPQGWVQ